MKVTSRSKGPLKVIFVLHAVAGEQKTQTNRDIKDNLVLFKDLSPEAVTIKCYCRSFFPSGATVLITVNRAGTQQKDHKPPSSTQSILNI